MFSKLARNDSFFIGFYRSSFIFFHNHQFLRCSVIATNRVIYCDFEKQVSRFQFLTNPPALFRYFGSSDLTFSWMSRTKHIVFKHATPLVQNTHFFSFVETSRTKANIMAPRMARMQGCRQSHHDNS